MLLPHSPARQVDQQRRVFHRHRWKWRRPRFPNTQTVRPLPNFQIPRFPDWASSPKSQMLKILTYAAVVIAVIAIGLAVFVPATVWLAIPARIKRLLNPPHPYREVVWTQDAIGASKLTNFLPNIILIVADDLGMNDLSGGAGVSTPHIDSIAANGINYRTAFAGHATCAPSRASLLTGRLPTKMGFEFTPTPKVLLRVLSWLDSGGLHPALYDQELAKATPPMWSMSLPAENPTIAERLRLQGYRSYLIGKWHLGGQTPSTPLDRGFDETITFPAGFSAYGEDTDPDLVRGPLQGSSAAFDHMLSFLLPFTVCHNNGPHFQPNEYMTDYLTHRAVDLIASRRGSKQPWFLALTYTAPHTPLIAKRADYEDPEVAVISNHNERVYAAMIKALDRGVGEVLQALKDNDDDDHTLSSNTLVIFTSDNGATRLLGMPNVSYPYRGWKGTLFEGGLRVPLFMQWPQRIAGGAVVDHPVSHADILPTLVAAAGGEEDASLDGSDLLQLRMGDRALFWRSGHYSALRVGRWKLQQAQRPQRDWLFDLLADPAERVNVMDMASSNATVLEALQRMRLRMKEVDEQQRPPLWPSVLEVAVPIDTTANELVHEDDEYVYWANC